MRMLSVVGIGLSFLPLWEKVGELGINTLKMKSLPYATY